LPRFNTGNVGKIIDTCIALSGRKLAHQFRSCQQQKKYDTNKIRSDFISGQQTLRQLVDQYGCSYSYLASLSSRERWHPKRRELQRQQEETATDALVERVTERSAELAKLKALTAEEHVSRSLQVGEQLHVLLQQALAALEAHDVRQLKTAVDCWSTWDKQMRANHRIEDKEAQKPLIDIHVMAALPSMAEMKRRQEEQEAIEAEAA